MTSKLTPLDLQLQKYGEGHRQGWYDALQDTIDWLRRRDPPQGDIRGSIGADVRRALVSAFRERLPYPGTTTMSSVKVDVHFGLRLSGHDDGNTNALCGVLLSVSTEHHVRAPYTTRMDKVTCAHCRSQLTIIGRDYSEARRAKRIEW